jgi:hypothetical protein
MLDRFRLMNPYLETHTQILRVLSEKTLCWSSGISTVFDLASAKKYTFKMKLDVVCAAGKNWKYNSISLTLANREEGGGCSKYS